MIINADIPFAFVNAIYMGEVFHCKVLHSTNGKVDTLKELLSEYPQTDKRASIKKFLWECEFSLLCGKKAIAKQDIVYGSGSLFRCADCLIYAAFSFNEMYCLNEKGILNRLLQREGAVLPENFGARIENALSMLKRDTGVMVFLALEAAEALAKEGVSARVINASTIKPLDPKAVLGLCGGARAVVTAEEHSPIGGLGSAICDALSMSRLPVARVGIQDSFGTSAQDNYELMARYGLTAEAIADRARAALSV